MATVNLGRIKPQWQGTYASETSYVVDDMVLYSGSTYICTAASQGNAPTNTSYWNLMSQGFSGDAADLSTGTIPDARFPATLPAIDGSALTGVGGGLQSMQVFGSSGGGSFTWTKPAGINRIKVIVTGAGGSGGGGQPSFNNGGGGSAGGTAIKIIDVSSVSSVSVTVGSGGAGVSGNAASGNNGGSSSFGAYCSATGGEGGGGGSQSNASGSGIGSGGDLNIQGGLGDAPSGGNNADEVTTGLGGASYWGGGGNGAPGNNNDISGRNGKAWGSGGGGADEQSGSFGSSGAGKHGIVVVEEYA